MTINIGPSGVLLPADFYFVMPAKAGIQYPEEPVILTSVAEYWIIRFRG
jgi:hypothetical protein